MPRPRPPPGGRTPSGAPSRRRAARARCGRCGSGDLVAVRATNQSDGSKSARVHLLLLPLLEGAPRAAPSGPRTPRPAPRRRRASSPARGLEREPVRQHGLRRLRVELDRHVVEAAHPRGSRAARRATARPASRALVTTRMTASRARARGRLGPVERRADGLVVPLPRRHPAGRARSDRTRGRRDARSARRRGSSRSSTTSAKSVSSRAGEPGSRPLPVVDGRPSSRLVDRARRSPARRPRSPCRTVRGSTGRARRAWPAAPSRSGSSASRWGSGSSPSRLIQTQGRPSSAHGAMSWKRLAPTWTWRAGRRRSRRRTPPSGPAPACTSRSRRRRRSRSNGTPIRSSDAVDVVAVGVREDRELPAAGAQLLERAAHLGKRLPGRQRPRERVVLARRQRQALLGGEPREREREHVAVAARRLLALHLRLDLVVAGRSRAGAPGAEEPLELGADAAVPVDQRPVAVEGRPAPAHCGETS